MNQLVSFRKIIAYEILVLAGLVGVTALLLGYESVAKGFVLGSLFSLFNFLIMFRHAPNVLGKSRKAATASSGFSLIVRLGLLAIPIYLGIRYSEFHLIWTLLGVFNLQFSIIIYGQVVQRFLPADDPTG